VLANHLQRDSSVVGAADGANQVVRVIDLDLVRHYYDVAASKSGFPGNRSLDDVSDEHAFRLNAEDIAEVRIERRELGAGERIDTASEPERGNKK
jgi:hypothetical protein